MNFRFFLTLYRPNCRSDETLRNPFQVRLASGLRQVTKQIKRKVRRRELPFQSVFESQRVLQPVHEHSLLIFLRRLQSETRCLKLLLWQPTSMVLLPNPQWLALEVPRPPHPCLPILILHLKWQMLRFQISRMSCFQVTTHLRIPTNRSVRWNLQMGNIRSKIRA